MIIRYNAIRYGVNGISITFKDMGIDCVVRDNSLSSFESNVICEEIVSQILTFF